MKKLYEEIQKTSLTPLLWVLVIIIGGVATLIMYLYDLDMKNLWMPWVLPNICFLQPLYGSIYWRRYKCFSKALETWNRFENPGL